VNLNINLQDSLPAWSQPVEMVERKGKGHPDTICDALADHLSNILSQYYLQRFGFILHHNVDKALLCGGVSHAVFSGGEVLRPIEIYLAGRATEQFQGVSLPIRELAIDAARQWLDRNLHALDFERHVRLHCRIRPGSRDLADLYMRGRTTAASLANDTSTGVGYAPLDVLETVVLDVERHLNSATVKETHPAIGEDVKVMGVRRGDRIALTIACAMVSRHLRNLADYQASKVLVAQLARQAAARASSAPVDVTVNGADGETTDGLYLTVTGTSAESGDDGEVGRGNRSNGLITPYRPMTMEAVAGKNPTTHVGKLYNVGAGRIARQIVAQIGEVQEAYCWLTSQIGRKIEDPTDIHIQLRLHDGAALRDVESRVGELVRNNLAALPDLWRELITGSQTPW